MHENQSSLVFDTRLAAYKRVARTKQETKTRILQAYRERGPEGYTTEELAQTFGCDKDHVRPRVSELKQDLLLRDSGRRRRTRSGCWAKVLIHFEFAKQEEDLTVSREELARMRVRRRHGL
jgi:transcription initiation factor IIE alpha subunit